MPASESRPETDLRLSTDGKALELWRRRGDSWEFQQTLLTVDQAKGPQGKDQGAVLRQRARAELAALAGRDVPLAEAVGALGDQAAVGQPGGDRKAVEVPARFARCRLGVEHAAFPGVQVDHPDARVQHTVGSAGLDQKDHEPAARIQPGAECPAADRVRPRLGPVEGDDQQVHSRGIALVAGSTSGYSQTSVQRGAAGRKQPDRNGKATRPISHTPSNPSRR